MAISSEPDLELARKTLPAPLFTSLRHVYAQGISDCMLAGGTALAGFYARHRRSDDLDLFTKGPSQQRAAVLAVKSLAKIGVRLEILSESAQYLEVTGFLEGHPFKVTAVLDENLFRIGTSARLSGNVQVAALETIFRMKAATLASRCSEKDLFDLIWLFGRFPALELADLVRLGKEYDGGLNAENVLSTVAGASIRKDACSFALDPAKPAAKVHEEILAFRGSLLTTLEAHLDGEPVPPLGKLVRKLGRLR